MLGDLKVLKVNRKFVLCGWLLLDLWEKICGRSNEATVGAKEQHRELGKFFYPCLGRFLTFKSDVISRNHESVLVVLSLKRNMKHQ